MKESAFQSRLKNEIVRMWPGAIILKNDPINNQGFPDLLVLYRDRWAALEVKRSTKALHRPNQDYYIDILGKMSYASFVSPETKDKIFSELCCHFSSARHRGLRSKR